VLSPWTGPVALSVAALAQTLGRRDEAQARFRSAVALCERTRTPAYLAIAQYELGRFLAPADEGRRLLEHAQASADQLGMPGWAARAGAELACSATP
jgi:hypothetical protein